MIAHNHQSILPMIHWLLTLLWLRCLQHHSRQLSQQWQVSNSCLFSCFFFLQLHFIANEWLSASVIIHTFINDLIFWKSRFNLALSTWSAEQFSDMSRSMSWRFALIRPCRLANLWMQTTADHLLTVCKAAWYILLVMSVCLSVCQTITFESLGIGSSYLHGWCISREYGSSSYMKVIRSKWRLQEQKRLKIPLPAM